MSKYYETKLVHPYRWLSKVPMLSHLTHTVGFTHNWLSNFLDSQLSFTRAHLTQIIEFWIPILPNFHNSYFHAMLSQLMFIPKFHPFFPSLILIPSFMQFQCIFQVKNPKWYVSNWNFQSKSSKCSFSWFWKSHN